MREVIESNVRKETRDLDKGQEEGRTSAPTDEGWWVKVSFIKIRKMEGGKIAGEARRCRFGNELSLKRPLSAQKSPATRQLEVLVSSSGQGSRQRLATAEHLSEAEIEKAGNPSSPLSRREEKRPPRPASAKPGYRRAGRRKKRTCEGRDGDLEKDKEAQGQV